MFSEITEESVQEKVQDWDARLLYISLFLSISALFSLLFLYSSVTQNIGMGSAVLQGDVGLTQEASVSLWGSFSVSMAAILGLLTFGIQVVTLLYLLFNLSDIIAGVSRAENFPRTIGEVKQVKYEVFLMVSLVASYQIPLVEQMFNNQPYIVQLLLTYLLISSTFVVLIQIGQLGFTVWLRRVRNQDI